MIPRAMMDTRAPEYVEQTLKYLSYCWGHVDDDFNMVERVVKDLEECKAWETYPPEQPAGSLDALLRQAIGVNVQKVMEAVRKARAAQELARPEAEGGVAPAADHGTNQHTRSQEVENNGQETGGADSTSCEKYTIRGTGQASYLVRRLKRDAPEIAQALAEGKYPSARAAAIAAGIVKVPTVVDLLKKAWTKATSEERLTFLNWTAQEGGAA